MIGKEDFSQALDECIQRWPTLKGQIAVYYSHLNWMPSDAFRELCSRFVENLRSAPLPKDFKEEYGVWKKDNWEKDPDTEKLGFLFSAGVNCRSCDHKGALCIQEPVGSEWRCRQCYTGFTNSEIKDKFRMLFERMGGEKSNDVCPF